MRSISSSLYAHPGKTVIIKVSETFLNVLLHTYKLDGVESSVIN